ncbi:MAG TPA: type II secretion system F family protein [Armatimonadota bacterium]|nr:type II secretion system F family protein [Armatimonadota bacterium]
MTYAYTGVDSAGKPVKGKIEAENQQLVLARLHEQGYHVTGVTEQRKFSLLTRSKKVKLDILVVFSRQLATMINAGISIVKCLDILGNQLKDPVLKPVINQTMRDVKNGISLTDALAKHGSVFSKLYINMIRAAELSGTLDEILDRLAGFLEYEMEVRTKIKSAMMYPIIVLIFSCCMVFVLMTFVLPKFKEIFDSMNVEMPIYTKLLFDASDLFKHFWYVPVILVVGVLVFVKQTGKTKKGRYQIDYLKLKVPIVGDIIQKMAISRFSRTFGTLVSSGVPMMRALEIVGETAGNAVIAKGVQTARESVREGQKISAPLETTGLFPTMVTHMIDVGEETGRLSDMLVKVSEFYEKEVDAAVKGLTSLIEPMLIVFMGVVVGFIAISVMGPIFKLVSSVN